MVRSLDVDEMFAHSCGKEPVGDMKATIEHNWEGKGCFCKRKFGMQMVIGYYSGTSMRTSFYGDKDFQKNHIGKGMSISVEKLQNCALSISPVT